MNFTEPLFQDKLNNNTVLELQKCLINDLAWLLKKSNDYDVIINVGEPPNIKSFRVHSSVLKARSLYFRAILSSGHHSSSKERNSLFEITHANIKPELFDVILNYLYTGIISLESEKNTRKLFEIIIAAEKLWLYPLVQYIEHYLINQMRDWLKSNFVYLLTMIRSNQSSFKLLHKFSEYILKNHPQLLFDSDDFHNLPEPILINLLQHRNFSKNVTEKDILSIVLDWGIKQNNDLIDKNVTNWYSMDFSKLQTSLQHIIPLIRYTSIPPKEFFNIMGPYRQIFTPGLYERIMQIPTFASYTNSKRPSVPPRTPSPPHSLPKQPPVPPRTPSPPHSLLKQPPVPSRTPSPAHSLPKQPIFPSSPLISLLQEFPKPPSTTPPITRPNSPTDRFTPRSIHNRSPSGLNSHRTLSTPIPPKPQLVTSSTVIKSGNTIIRRTRSLVLSNKPRVFLVRRANSLPARSQKRISIYSVETSNNSSSLIKAKLRRSRRTTISPSRRQTSNLSISGPITSPKATKSIEPQVIRKSLVKEDFGKEDRNIRIPQVMPLNTVKSSEPQVVDTKSLVMPFVMHKDLNRKVSNSLFPPAVTSIVSFEPQIISANQPIEGLDKKARYRKYSIISSSRPSTPITI